MYEHASVLSLQDNGVVTVMCQTAGCENCKAGSFCATKGKTFIAQNDTEQTISVGDMVELYLPPGKTVLAGFVALLVPVLLFPVGYYLPSALVADVGEGVRIISGIGGIAVGFMISRIFSKAKAKEYIPKITRVIDRQTN